MFSSTSYFFVRKEEKEDVSEKKRLKRGILKEKRKKRWSGMSEYREISLHSCSSDFDGFPARHSVVDLVKFLPNKLLSDPIGTG